MKKEAMKYLGLGGIMVGLLAGCASHHPHSRVVVTPSGQVVTQAPPAPRQESQGQAPGAEYAWVQGYWAFANDRWVWLPGHWTLRPREGVAWVAGHWDQTEQGWVWRGGHWE